MGDETREWERLKDKPTQEVKTELEVMPASDLLSVGRHAIYEQLEEAPNKAQLEATLEAIFGRFEAAVRGVQPISVGTPREAAMSR
jgi:hypothetical protein